ncbi:amidohydrolase [Dactylosporangium roseum]|uniref:Amidohydrolase n=1 Tax=Dactylosporangium roseum TaxID=47989 RepID=A0ABY5ZCD3_9ACTN|nr:amidohydrolase family protein [Dactylosporangium roseum]UWZ39226.1 amidohydrolase [Dactylosporangium roseum]
MAIPIAETTHGEAAEATPGHLDVHAHIHPPRFTAALERLAGGDPSGGLDRFLADAAEKGARAAVSPTARFMYAPLEERIELLDRGGIAVQVLSAGSSLAVPLPEEANRALVAAWNDAVDAEIREFDGRFLMFASLPFPHVEAALDELERVGDRASVVGFTMNSQIQGRALADEAWKPVFRAWNERSAVVFCHPNGFRCGPFEPRYLTVDVGTQFEDTLTGLQLAESGYLDEFPDIRWIVPHLGGTLPFVIGRVDEHWERDAPTRQTALKPSEYLNRLLFDTAGHDAFAVKVAVERFGVDKFLFGSDFPMVRPEQLPELLTETCGAIEQLGADPNTLLATARRALGLDALGAETV